MEQANRKNMIGLKVVMGDPAGTLSPFQKIDIQNDPFGIVGAQFDIDKYKIRFKLARQFQKEPLEHVAKYLMGVKKKVKPNFMGLETNNRGKDILEYFKRKYKMDYLHGVATSQNMTEKTRSMGYTMDKVFMVKWFAEQQETGLFEFSNTPSKDMEEFTNQIAEIVPLMTANGSTTYKRMRGRHDDLFMAGLHCCNFIRLFIEQQERLK